jgi:serine/threonine protein kinase
MSLENQYQQTLKTKQCPSCGTFVDPSLTVCPKDGTSLVERFDKDPAFVNYEFLGTIGAGGMGVIYKARQLILNKLVAIKTLHPHLSSPAAFRRFQIEGQTTSLLRHPFIVSVHDFGVTKSGQTFMVMDFVDGETLDSLLRRIGQLDEQHFLSIFIDVCDALHHAHSRSVIHRDIKSSNIMIVKGDNGKDEIRILDFGIAKLVSDTESGANNVTKTGEVIGTATCMSPEQARGGKVDHRSDLYALGCVMYESLATSPPFVGNNPLETMLMHLEKKPLPIKEASMGHVVDPRIEKIIFCLLEKDPEHRYQSMIDLKHDLENLRNSKFAGAKTAEFRMPNKSVQAEKKSWRFPVIAAGLSLLVISSIGFRILFLNGQHGANRQAPLIRTETPVAIQSGAATAETHKNEAAGNAMDSILGIEAGKSSKQNKDAIVRTGLESQLALNEPKVMAREVNFAGVVIPIVNDDLTVFKGNHPETHAVELDDAVKVTDEGFKNLQDLVLTDLDLKNCGATDLDWIVGQTELRHLNISCSQISPKGFQNIGKLKGLKYLDISSTPFKDSDIKSIRGLGKLEKLLVEDSLISASGYDQLLNSFPHAINIDYFPAKLVKAGQPAMGKDRLRNDLQNYLTGTLSPVDSRPTEVIFQEAQKAMKNSDWQKADVALQKVILKLLGPARFGKASKEQVLMLVTAEGYKGDCLRNMNLPYAAIYMYNLTSTDVKNNELGRQFAGDMARRVAEVFETISNDPEALEKAMDFRNVAIEELKPFATVQPWAALRASCLDALRRDQLKSGQSTSGANDRTRHSI